MSIIQQLCRKLSQLGTSAVKRCAVNTHKPLFQLSEAVSKFPVQGEPVLINALTFILDVFYLLLKS